MANIKHDMIIIKNSTVFTEVHGERINLDPKSSIKNIKYLEIQDLFNNQKNTAAVTSTQINTDFRNSKLQKVLC